MLELTGNRSFIPHMINNTSVYTGSHVVDTLLIVYYVLIVIVGFTGNILIVISVVKYKQLKSVVNIFLANLAVADILFVLLSLFDASQFILDEWVYGDTVCRVQGTAIEVSYTVSVVTLTTVALERYLSICYPYRRKRTVKQSVYTSIIIWIFAIAFCAVLMHGYHGKLEGNSYKCENDNWSNKSRLIFYIVHSVFVYLLPLGILCVAHYKISVVLAIQRQRTKERLNNRCEGMVVVERMLYKVNNSESEIMSSGCTEEFITAESKSKHNNDNVSNNKPLKILRTLDRRSNIIRLLVVITTIFLVLWSPFIVIRVFKYAEIEFDDIYFRVSQLLIFTNTAVNFFAYALMSTIFRKAFIGLLTCNPNDGNIMNRTKSHDIGDSVKKSVSSIKSVPKEEQAMQVSV